MGWSAIRRLRRVVLEVNRAESVARSMVLIQALLGIAMMVTSYLFFEETGRYTLRVFGACGFATISLSWFAYQDDRKSTDVLASIALSLVGLGTWWFASTFAVDPDSTPTVAYVAAGLAGSSLGQLSLLLVSSSSSGGTE